LLATLFAATTSALSIGRAARAQECGGHRHRNGRHCRSFPIFSVHYPIFPFKLAAERGVRRRKWQVLFQCKKKPLNAFCYS
jgi:hypothetical protein